MITETGSIKVTMPCEKVQKEITRKTYVSFIIFLIVGSVGLAAYFILTFIQIFMELPDDRSYNILLIGSASLFALGLVFVISINKNLKKARERSLIATYEFFSDHFIFAEFDKGEQISTVKVYNKQIIKGRETNGFLFFYINNAMAYPVSKENLTEGELNTLRRMFKLPVKGETLIIPAEQLPEVNAPSVENSEQTSEERSTEPLGQPSPDPASIDPFADFDK